MKELSTEIIEIDGVDYTLFLNRTGIVAWEKYTKNEAAKVGELEDKYKNIKKENYEIGDFNKVKDDANPFDGMAELDDMEKDLEFMNNIYARLYWIMLYTHHKLKVSEALDLYKKACDEYGSEQVILLAQQMLNEVNADPEEGKQLKNLAALKSTKK